MSPWTDLPSERMGRIVCWFRVPERASLAW